MKTTGKCVGGGRTVSAVALLLVLGIQAWAVDPAASTNLPAQSTIWGQTNSSAPPLQTSVPAFPLGGTNAAPRAGSPNLPGATAAMLGSMAFSQSLTNSPPADLIVWWIFGEGIGTNVEDASGNGNSGRLLGNPLPTWANGVTSGALTFDGSQNYVQSDQAFNQTISAFTIEAWFAATSVYGENPAILSTLGDDIGFNSLADIVIYTNSIYNGNSIGLDLHWGDLLLAPVGLIDGNWHHVAGVWDGTNSSLYVDGQLVATQSDVHAAFTWTTPLRLAYRDTNGGCRYGGQIGEVRIYSRALSGDEVATNYNADTIGDGIPDWWRLRYFGSGTTTNGVSCATCDPNGNRIPNSQEYQNNTNPLLPSGLTVSTNLIAWWMFDEGTGAFVGDVSGNGHCGVLLGNSPPTWTNGVTSGALSFDGNQNYVQTELPFHETISAYTIEAWFSAVSAYGQNPAIISTLGDDIGFNSLADIVIYTNSTYNGHNSIGLDMHWGDLLLAYMGLFDGNWHQVTGTWDGSNSTLYVDGQMVATQADVHGSFSWTTPLRLAYRDTNGGCNFGGDIGEIRIYDQALSSNEVLASYNTDTVDDGIPNWWRQEYFGIGTTTNDRTCADCVYTNSDLDNLQAYDCGLDPLVPYVISAPPGVGQGTTNTASIPSAGTGASYTWSVANNGTLVSGQDTTNITWVAGNPGTATISVTLSNSPSCVVALTTTLAVVNHAYYVDYQNGSDTNGGTNPSSAWQHCHGDQAAHNIAQITPLIPGDTIFFKGGVNYVLTSTGVGITGGILLSINSSGLQAPITYDGNTVGTWGTGPAIITDHGATNWHAGFYASGSDVSNVAIQGFLFTGIGGIGTNAVPNSTNSEVAFNGGYGVYITGGKLVGSLITGNTFTNIGYWQNFKPFGACSIAQSGCGDGVSPAAIAIQGGAVNTTISSNNFSCVFAGLDMAPESVVSNLTIANNVFGNYEVWGTHIGMAGGSIDYTYIYSNKFQDIGGAYAPGNDTGYDVGAMHQDPFFLVASFPESPNCGSNIDIYANSFTMPSWTSGTVSAICYIEGGMSVNIYNNLYNMPQAYAPSGAIGLAPDNNVGTSFVVRVVNNTMIVNQANLAWSATITVGAGSNLPPYQAPYVWPTNNSPLLVANNIGYSFTENGYSDGYDVIMGQLTNSWPISTWTFDYNNWFSPQPPQYYSIFWLNNSVTNSLNTNGWLNVMQYLGMEAHGRTNDPLFVSLAYGAGTGSISNNYQLQSESPAIGAGTNLTSLGLPGLNYNLNGQTNGRPATGQWNQGAY